jgi:hypothetical protein
MRAPRRWAGTTGPIPALLVAALVFGCGAGGPRAQEAAPVHIQAILAMQVEGACTTALGFVVESGPDKSANYKKVVDKLRAQFPRARSNFQKDNFKKQKHMGRHMVVVSAGTGKPGCTGRAMGIGFGKDATEARKDAEEALGKIWPFAGGAMKVEHSKAY